MNVSAPVLLVACDGSCLSNPGGATGWAWVSETGASATGGAERGTNQIAELWGLISVLRDHPMTSLRIQTDSEYARKCATVWREQWRARGWVLKNGGPIANKELVLVLDVLMANRTDLGLSTVIEHVPGHDAQNRWPLNTQADALAVDAAKRARSGDVGVRRAAA